MDNFDLFPTIFSKYVVALSREKESWQSIAYQYTRYRGQKVGYFCAHKAPTELTYTRLAY